MRDIIEVFKALSDETRLRILAILVERECCVCEVEQALGISQSRASRNLRILERAGLIQDRRDGVWKVYSVSPDAPMAPLTELLAQQVKSAPALREDRERLKRTVRRNPEYDTEALPLPKVLGS